VKRRRVVAYVTRRRGGQTELLVFDDADNPQVGVQVPAGRLDDGEGLEEGLLRELAEETGLEHARIVRELPGFEQHYPSRYENHGFHVVLEADAPDEWEHVVHGEGDDAGLVFRFRWVPVTGGAHLFGRPHPSLERLAEPIDDA
jgi:8-oxo-dGTP pyrophosphatase MutT (NUDIX family)